MNGCFSVVGVDTGNARGSVMFQFDDKHYLFNCGEGSQRVCREHKVRTRKLRAVFFTRASWATFGGFPGLMLTLSENGSTQLSVRGPPATTAMALATRYFVQRSSMTLQLRDVDTRQQLTFQDDNISVTAYLVLPRYHAGAESVRWVSDKHSAITLVDVDRDGVATVVMDRVRGEKRPKTEDAPLEVPIEGGVPMAHNTSIVYKVKVADVRGVFNPDRALELGVPRGPLFGKLSRGIAVVSPGTGETVHPSQVMSESVEGSSVLLVDVCDVSAVAQLPALHETEFQCVVHFTDAAIASTPQYRRWIDDNLASCGRHILLNGMAEQRPIYSSYHSMMAQLSAVSPMFFTPKSLPQAPLGSLTDLFGVTAGCTGQKVVLSPQRRRAFLDVVVQKDRGGPVVAPLPVMRDKCPPWEPGAIEVCTLGTGASRPSKYRNVSSSYVNLGSGRGYLMLDAGEGTVGQFVSRFGSDYEQHINQICAVFISHMHADHHLGLIQILSLRSLASSGKPLVVVGPPALEHWLSEISQCQQLCPYEFFNNYQVTTHHETLKGMLGLEHFEVVKVRHCNDAFGLVASVSRRDGSVFTFVFSGDTRPCDRLNRAGDSADLLIHEATFDDSMARDAKSKRHSTVGEALGAARQMRAAYTVLTHFSQRYPKSVASSGDGGSGYDDPLLNSVGMAFDLMCLQEAHFPLMYKLEASLRQINMDDEDDDVNVV